MSDIVESILKRYYHDGVMGRYRWLNMLWAIQNIKRMFEVDVEKKNSIS